MNIWIGKITLLVGTAAVIVIRAPHGRRNAKLKVVQSERGKLEIALLTLMWFVGIVLPIVWVATPLFSFADYPLYPAPYCSGVVLFLLGLWLFYRAHADLATNWSYSLDIRENHTLITTGVYRRIRHPMYASIFLLAIGQALFVSNWIVGPIYLCGFALLFVLRVGREERMMLQRFGSDYETYMEHSKRLIPGIW